MIRYILFTLFVMCSAKAVAQKPALVGTWKGTSSNKEDPCVFVVKISQEHDSLRIKVGRIEGDNIYKEWEKCNVTLFNEKAIYFYRDIISHYLTGEKHNGKEIGHTEDRLYHNVKLVNSFLYLRCTRMVLRWYDIYGDLIDEKTFDFDTPEYDTPDILIRSFEDENGKAEASK